MVTRLLLVALASSLLSLMSCARGADPVSVGCGSDVACGPGNSCVLGKCVINDGSSGAAGDGAAGDAQGGAGPGGAGQGGAGSSTAGAGGAGAAGKGAGGAAGMGVRCKDSADGCSCKLGYSGEASACGTTGHPSRVCCPTSPNWPDEGVCSCLEVRAASTSSGCNLAYSSDPKAAISCMGSVCCQSADKLSCQCFNDAAMCPAGAKVVPSCTAVQLGCGDMEAISDCN
jgi:hypothetical protein